MPPFALTKDDIFPMSIAWNTFVLPFTPKSVLATGSLNNFNYKGPTFKPAAMYPLDLVPSSGT